MGVRAYGPHVRKVNKIQLVFHACKTCINNNAKAELPQAKEDFDRFYSKLPLINVDYCTPKSTTPSMAKESM